MERDRSIDAVRLIVALLVSATFLLVGLAKIAGQELWLQKFAHWGYPREFVQAIGVAESLGAILLWVPRWTRSAALVLATIMIGASYTHVASREGWDLLRPIIYLVLLGIIVWLRREAPEVGAAIASPAAASRDDIAEAPAIEHPAAAA